MVRHIALCPNKECKNPYHVYDAIVNAPKFCPYCGTQLMTECPKCGEIITETVSGKCGDYCTNCGKKFVD